MSKQFYYVVFKEVKGTSLVFKSTQEAVYEDLKGYDIRPSVIDRLKSLGAEFSVNLKHIRYTFYPKNYKSKEVQNG